MTLNSTGGLLAALAIFSLSVSAQSHPDKDTLTARHSSRQETYRVYRDDASGNREEELAAYVDERHYKIRSVNGKIVELYVDGRRIAEDSVKVFDPVVAVLEERIKKDKEESLQDQARAWKDRQQAEMDRERYRKDRQQAEMDKRLMEEDLRRAQRDTLRNENDAREETRDKKQAEMDFQMEARHIVKAEKYEQLEKEYSVKARIEYIQARAMNRQRAVAYRHREDEEAEEGARQMRADRQMMRDLIRELVSDKIIGSEKDLVWMALTDTKLIVNGKKQPNTAHEKFRSKYITKPGFGIFYGDSQVQGTGLFLNKQDLDQRDL